MSHPGFGVMLHMLSGNANSVAVVKASLNQTITALKLGEDDALHFEFADGSKMKLWDDGQSCCESRYMRTDDNLADFVGATLLDLELRDAPDVKDTSDDYGEEHDVQFLVVKTSRGDFTMSNHNEHNGYYGGFAIVASAE